jgi:hypothetical protein
MDRERRSGASRREHRREGSNRTRTLLVLAAKASASSATMAPTNADASNLPARIG